MSGIISNVMDMFRGAPVQPNTAPGAAPIEGGAVAAAANPTVPAGQEVAGTATAGAVDNNPLDTFKDLWTPPTADNKQPAVADMFNINPQQLMEAASKVDFARMIPQESLQAIAAGGEGAAKAFSAALNSVAQSVYAQSAAANTQILKEALSKQQQEFQAQLPTLIKTQTLSNSMKESNPALSHPAAAPLVQAIQQTLQAKHPNATSAELQQMAQQYVGVFADAVKGKQPEQTPEVKPGDVDWSTYL